MRRVRGTVGAIVIGVMTAGLLGACEKGPAQKAGEKIDDAVDKLSGKGPAEKVGERIDEATKELKKN